MEAYKEEFIAFMVRAGVLTFGDFTTKSGRKTPYFINTGNYDTGPELSALGGFYARALNEKLGQDFDNLYGPAYKGIPLCVACSIALERDFGRSVSFTFNRKEAKDHGEGGSLIGHRYQGGERVVIIEDVITAGTSVRESVPLIQATPGTDLRAVIVSVDRMERGSGERSALDEIADEYGIQVLPIVTIDEVVACLRAQPVDGKTIIDDETASRIADYRAQYGATSR